MKIFKVYQGPYVQGARYIPAIIGSRITTLLAAMFLEATRFYRGEYRYKAWKEA